LQTYNVIIQPEGREVKVLEGSTIMEAMNDAGVDFDFPCGQLVENVGCGL